MTVSVPLLRVVRGDITQVRADVVVNAANRTMRGGGGVDGAIHRVGGPAILEDCIRRFPQGLPTGGVGWTTAGDLPARYVVHAVGPNHGAGEHDPDLLRSCYAGAIRTATDLGARSMAVPLISAGVYSWPLDDAISIALETMLETPGDLYAITLVAFDDTVEARVRALLNKDFASCWVAYRIIDAVALLHRAGYRRLRFYGGIGGPGCWRATIADARWWTRDPDWSPRFSLGPREAFVRYSSASEQKFVDMTVEPWTDPIEVAAAILRRLGDHAVVGGDAHDDAYVDWFTGLRDLVKRRRAIPEGNGDDFMGHVEFDTRLGWQVGKGALYPLPPVVD